MASSKRCRLNGPEETKNISAFAARRHLKSPKSMQDSESSFQHEEKQSHSQNEMIFSNTSLIDNRTSNVSKAALVRGVHSSPHDDDSSGSPSYESAGIEQEENDSSLNGEIIVDETLPVQRLSTMSSNSIIYKENGAIVRIVPGERLVVLGSYGLSVNRGQVSILGAVLSPSTAAYNIYALSSHSLPVIRSTNMDGAGAEVHLHELENSLDTLGYLSPLFSKLGYNGRIQHLKSTAEDQKQERKRSFQILFLTEDGPPRRLLQRMVLAPEWNEALATFSSKAHQSISYKLVICGPKSSGKSTFVRLLINRLLTINPPIDGKKPPMRTASPGVILLDLDPGQPEYSPPGQISLLHVSTLNFGPPYTHPDSSAPGITLVRAHSIMAVSPAADLDYYAACISDLLFHYRHFIASRPNCPLVINTPGWVLGTGLEILTDLIARSRPTDIIYMSTEGPLEVVETLQKSGKNIPIVTLPSQSSEYVSRTAANLRAMQYMSYFHSSACKDLSPSWNSNPLTAMPPWEVKYTGSDAGFLGILCLGEKPPPDMLKDAINGTIVAVVVIDELAAIGLEDNRGQESEDLDEEYPYQGTAAEYPQKLIIRTPDESLPYFNPEIPIVLEPNSSQAIGLALVRGIDTINEKLQLLTPIFTDTIRGIEESGKPIILVCGKLDTPGWAYTEELYERATQEKARGVNLSVGPSEFEEEDIDERKHGEYLRSPASPQLQSTNPPWVQTLSGDQGRGTAGRVWRVRRDLGRAGTGDD